MVGVSSHRLMSRSLPALILMLVCAAALGQNVVKLKFESASPRIVWVAEMPPESDPEGVTVEGPEYELRTASGPADQVFVYDTKTGNLASKKLAEIGPEWKVKSSDFRFVLKVHVRVEHKGEPIAAASVDLRDGRQDTTKIIDGQSGGIATFYSVRTGSVRIAVNYRTGDKTPSPLKQQFELQLKRSEAEPTLVVAIADPVETAPEKAASGGTSAKSSKTAAGEKGTGSSDTAARDAGGKTRDMRNPIGGVATFLLATAVGIALIWFGYQWMRKNSDAVQAKLEQLGVEVPKPADSDDGSATVVQPAAPPPVEKIILDGAAVAPAAQVVASGTPRLVSESGSVFEIPDGETSVGREFADLEIAGESTVSRKHAMISRDGSKVIVNDVGSTNGTFLNGVRIDSPTELRIGDRVQFGSAVFRYEA